MSMLLDQLVMLVVLSLQEPFDSTACKRMSELQL